MRRMAAYSMRQPRFLGVSTAFAPHQAHLSRQVHQSQQVAPRERHRVLRLHAIQPTHHRAAHCRPGLRPGMYPLRHLPFGPADLIAGMWTGASINGTAAGTARILRHMRRDIARPTVGHKFSRIVVLVGPQRAPLGIRPVRVSRVGPSSPAPLHARRCRSRESTWPRLQSRAGSR